MRPLNYKYQWVQQLQMPFIAGSTTGGTLGNIAAGAGGYNRYRRCGPTLAGAPIGASVEPDFMLSQVTARRW